MWMDQPLIPLQDPAMLPTIAGDVDMPELVGTLAGRLGQRRRENPARITLLSKPAAEVLFHSPLSQPILRMVNCGCGAFQKCTGATLSHQEEVSQPSSHRVAGATWRIPHAAVPILVSVGAKRVIPQIPFPVFQALMGCGVASGAAKDQGLTFSEIENLDSGYAAMLRGLESRGQCYATVAPLREGEHIPAPEGPGLDAKLVNMLLGNQIFALWVGADSLTLHVQRNYRGAMTQLITGTVVRAIETSGMRRRKRALEARREARKETREANQGRAGEPHDGGEAHDEGEAEGEEEK